jgi:hypothetical protein
MLDGTGNQCFDIGFQRYVAARKRRVPTHLPDQIHRFFTARHIYVGHHDLRSFARKDLCGSAPHAGGTAGDEGYFSFGYPAHGSPPSSNPHSGTDIRLTNVLIAL